MTTTIFPLETKGRRGEEGGCTPWGVLPGIFGGGVPAGSSKSWLYFRPKNIIFAKKIMPLLLSLEQQHKRFLKIHFAFAYFSFFLSHLELKLSIRSYTLVVSSKTIPDSGHKWAKSMHVFRPKGAKTQTLRAARTDMACIRDYPPGLYTGYLKHYPVVVWQETKCS